MLLISEVVLEQPLIAQKVVEILSELPTAIETHLAETRLPIEA